MKRIVGLLILFVAAQLLGGLLMFLVTLAEPSAEGLGTSGTAFSLLVSQVALMVFLWFSRWVAPADVVGRRVAPAMYAAVLLLMIPALFLANWLTEMLQLEDVNGELLRQLMHTPCGVLTVALCAPLAEELLFRAGIQGHLQRCVPRTWQAVFLSSALFAVVHANPAQLPAAFLLGMVFGAVYRLTGSLWPSVLAHVFNNSLGVALELCGFGQLSFSALLDGFWAKVFAAGTAGVWMFLAGHYVWLHRQR